MTMFSYSFIRKSNCSEATMKFGLSPDSTSADCTR